MRSSGEVEALRFRNNGPAVGGGVGDPLSTKFSVAATGDDAATRIRQRHLPSSRLRLLAGVANSGWVGDG